MTSPLNHCHLQLISILFVCSLGILSHGLTKLLLSFENVFLCLHYHLQITLSKYSWFQWSQNAIFSQELTAMEEYAPYLQKMSFSSWGLTMCRLVAGKKCHRYPQHSFKAPQFDTCSTQLSNQRMMYRHQVCQVWQGKEVLHFGELVSGFHLLL